jgi:hypothetical protein
MRTRLASLAIATLVGAGLAAAQPRDVQTQIFRIEGTLAASQDEAQKAGFAALSVGFLQPKNAPTRWLGVVSARSREGDAFLGRQTVEQLAPYSPNLLVSGPSELIAKLRELPAGTRVAVTGMLDPHSRNYLVSSLQLPIVPPKED